MYRFKKELNLDFRKRSIASKEIGIHQNTLGMILRGDITCSKAVADSITRLLHGSSKIEYYFNEEKGEKLKEKNENRTNK